MASVNEDGYVFQTTSVTDLPIEMLTHILENSSLKDALSFGIANRDTFNAVSRNPNFAKRACKKEFFTKPYTRYSINRICDPDNTEFESRTEKFCKDKAQDYLCSRVFDNWANLLRLNDDGAYAVPNGFEVVTMEDMFDDDENLPDVKILTIPDSVRVIYGVGPFKLRERLERVEGMKNVNIIGTLAFCDCESLITITIPTSVTVIGRGAFDNCRSLKSVTLPNSITKIRAHTFSSCRSLESITIPYGVTEIRDLAFYNCWGLRSVIIPNSVTEIGRWAFFYCSSLESITIPNSVIKIGEEAFFLCRFKSITIPNSVTEIGERAFGGCDSLTSVTIPARFKHFFELERIFGTDINLDFISFTFT